MSIPTNGQTATTSGAREHARAQFDAVASSMPIIPASSASPPPGVDPTLLVWAETVAPGGYAHKVLAPGTILRLSDLEADACAHLLLFRADQPWERLNVADTAKVQWQAYTSSGQVLLSDQGRVMASVLSDTSGCHDALCGTSTLLHNTERYGEGSPESGSPAGRELFVLAAAKHGLEPRDLPPSVSFFKGVRVEPTSGRLRWLGGCGTPAAIEIKAEIPVVVLLANTTHPLDPAPAWHASALGVTAWRGEPTGPDDPVWSSTPEREQAFLNTVDDRDARARS